MVVNVRIRCVFISSLMIMLAFILAGCGTKGTEQGFQSATSFSLSGPGTLQEGSTFDVSLLANSIPGVYGFQFNIVYDPAVLEFVEMSPAAGLMEFGFPSSLFCIEKDTSVPGSITKIACTRTGAIGGASLNGPIFTMKFKALSKGTTAISIAHAKAVNVEINEITVTSGSYEPRIV